MQRKNNNENNEKNQNKNSGFFNLSKIDDVTIYDDNYEIIDKRIVIGKIIFISILLFFVIIGCIYLLDKYDKKIQVHNTEEITIEESEINELPEKLKKFDSVMTTDFRFFLQALSWKESRHNDSIIGKSNDVGRFQITPIFLKEANNVLKMDYFKLEDRYNQLKSEQMVYLVNLKHNPSFDVEKAIKIHNKYAPESYKREIIAKYIDYKSQYINKNKDFNEIMNYYNSIINEAIFIQN
jgi:hypothetical protein